MASDTQVIYSMMRVEKEPHTTRFASGAIGRFTYVGLCISVV